MRLNAFGHGDAGKTGQSQYGHIAWQSHVGLLYRRQSHLCAHFGVSYECKHATRTPPTVAALTANCAPINASGTVASTAAHFVNTPINISSKPDTCSVRRLHTYTHPDFM